MGAAIDRLVGLVEAKDRYDIPVSELLPMQLEAVNERLESRIGRIPLLANRAESAGIKQVREPADLVPLLFAHTTYKTYVERWLTEGKWDRMGKWLGTVSAYSVEGVDLDGIRGIDDWLLRLQPAGHYVTCSSGTTGKPAMLSCSKADLDFSGRTSVASFAWATGVKPESDRKAFGLMPSSNVVRNEIIRNAMIDAFSSRDTFFPFPVEPITVGRIGEMIAMRRKIADGTARPAEITAFERLSEDRQSAMDGAVDGIADALIAARGQKLMVNGMWAMLHKIAEAVRAKGCGPNDFHPDNTMVVGGGLKGAVLPSNYKEFILETFNVRPEHIYHLYSMQEINTPFPLCRAGRYHVAPWVMLLPLNQSGDELLDAGGGEIEGRAAFFDIALDGRWGGVISGDRITADFGKCPCGHQGPTVGPEIMRYADLPGGDKISCSGTIDAYIRGVA